MDTMGIKLTEMIINIKKILEKSGRCENEPE
jgi:hypothetical protein